MQVDAKRNHSSPTWNLKNYVGNGGESYVRETLGLGKLKRWG